MQVAQSEAEPVSRNQRPKQWARGGCLRHGARSGLEFAREQFADRVNAAIGGAGLAVEDLSGARAHGFGGGTVA